MVYRRFLRTWHRLCLTVVIFWTLLFFIVSLSCPLLMYPTTVYAQDTALLAKLADLVRRKGYKDISLGQLCDVFGLAARHPTCMAFQMPEAEGAWTTSFNTYVER